MRRRVASRCKSSNDEPGMVGASMGLEQDHRVSKWEDANGIEGLSYGMTVEDLVTDPGELRAAIDADMRIEITAGTGPRSETSLSFLKPVISDIRHLQIDDVDMVTDADILSDARRLRTLGFTVEACPDEAELAHLPELELFRGTITHGVATVLDNPGLRYLGVGGAIPERYARVSGRIEIFMQAAGRSKITLPEFAHPEAIRRLACWETAQFDLRQLSEMSNLAGLEIGLCDDLSSLSALSGLPRLSELTLWDVGTREPWDLLPDLPRAYLVDLSPAPSATLVASWHAAGWRDEVPLRRTEEVVVEADPGLRASWSVLMSRFDNLAAAVKAFDGTAAGGMHGELLMMGIVAELRAGGALLEPELDSEGFETAVHFPTFQQAEQVAALARTILRSDVDTQLRYLRPASVPEPEQTLRPSHYTHLKQERIDWWFRPGGEKGLQYEVDVDALGDVSAGELRAAVDAGMCISLCGGSGTASSTSLAFLAPILPILRDLAISTRNRITDLEILAGARNLRSLEFLTGGCTEVVDLSQLPHLEAFVGKITRSIASALRNPSLRTLGVIGAIPKSFTRIAGPIEFFEHDGGRAQITLPAFAHPEAMKRLARRGSAQFDLTQLTAMTHLEDLEISSCDDVHGLAALSALPGLSKVTFKGVGSDEPWDRIPRLPWAFMLDLTPIPPAAVLATWRAAGWLVPQMSQPLPEDDVVVDDAGDGESESWGVYISRFEKLSDAADALEGAVAGGMHGERLILGVVQELRSGGAALDPDPDSEGDFTAVYFPTRDQAEQVAALTRTILDADTSIQLRHMRLINS